MIDKGKAALSGPGWPFGSLFHREARISGWEALDGFRGLFCILIMVFHVVSYLAAWFPNQETPNSQSATKFRGQCWAPSTSSKLSLCFINVFTVFRSGFLVITGFLLVHPLFVRSRNLLASASPSNAEFSIRDFWYRRVTRTLPVLVLWFYGGCVCLSLCLCLSLCSLACVQRPAVPW